MKKKLGHVLLAIEINFYPENVLCTIESTAVFLFVCFLRFTRKFPSNPFNAVLSVEATDYKKRGK